jgi:cytochrome oxidase Cu insertion factor (SCO1/SenC/PrrC family)
MSPWASGAPTPLRGDERRRGRRVALAILAVCAAPTVAAWFAYFVWQPQSRTNYGELIEPRSLSDSQLRRVDGTVFRLSRLRGKWVLLQIDSAACGEGCRKKLLYLRQARLAQGRDADRIERVWLLSDSATPDPALLREPGLNVAHAPSKAFISEFPASTSPTDYIYVVDPLGNLMLRFPRDPDPRKMLRDISRLLRASRVG